MMVERISLRIILTVSCLLGAISLQGQEYRYVEATELTVTGKVFPDTPNPYHRMDTARYHGFTPGEVNLLMEASGIAIAFRTDSPSIRVLPKYVRPYFGGGTTGFAGRGFDLYIKKDGKWLWAAAGLQNDNSLDKPVNLIQDMDGTMKECLLYLPLRSEVASIQVGVEEGRMLEALERPFRHRVAVFGSSFTQVRPGGSESRFPHLWLDHFHAEASLARSAAAAAHAGGSGCSGAYRYGCERRRSGGSAGSGCVPF